jgi:hypothetical protein
MSNLFLADFSKQKEDIKKRNEAIQTASVLGTGAVVGGIASNIGLKKYRDTMSNLATRYDKTGDKYIKNSVLRDIKNKPLSNNVERSLGVKTAKLKDKSYKYREKVGKSLRNNKRNVTLASVGGAALGYSLYRGGKALINKIRNRKKDKTLN